MFDIFSSYLKSINNLIYLNFFLKNDFKKKRIFFYFPKKDLTNKDIGYIEFLFKKLNKKYLVLYGHNINNLKKKNFYFIKESLLPLLNNNNLFISNYICDKFPKSTKKIYLHHCIYDTPLTGKNNEKNTLKALLKYDYIFLSSYKIIKSIIYYFKLKKFDKNKLLSSGYPRLDFLNKRFKKNIKKDSIIIAIANLIAYPNHSIAKNILSIIRLLKVNFKYKIIIRPHPANRNIFNQNNFPDLFNYIYKEKRIKIDLNDNYLDSYKKSILMITDLSGTAYTYSFLTNSPVLFFSRNEKEAKKNYSNLKHFEDRKKIGKVITNLKDLKISILNLIKNKNNFKKKISILKNNRLDFLGTSQERFVKLINQIDAN